MTVQWWQQETIHFMSNKQHFSLGWNIVLVEIFL